jgi:hypothetical protein
MPVLVGRSMAYGESLFHPFHFFQAAVANMAINAGTNPFDDSYDHLSRTDGININLTAFSSCSRAIQQRQTEPWQIPRAAWFCFGHGHRALPCLLRLAMATWIIIMAGSSMRRDASFGLKGHEACLEILGKADEDYPAQASFIMFHSIIGRIVSFSLAAQKGSFFKISRLRRGR